MNQHKWLLWTGRISGLLITAFFASFFIGEGLPDVADGKGKSLIELLPFAAVAFFGFFWAWFRPAPGGWMLVAGALILVGYFFYRGEGAMALVYGLPAFLVGLCFLAAANKQVI